MSAAARAFILEMLDTIREQPDLLREVQLVLGGGEADASGDEWINSAEAAAHLRINAATLRALAASGDIPSTQEGPGCRRYYRRSELDAWRSAGGTRG